MGCRDLQFVFFTVDPNAPVPQERATPSPPPAEDSEEDRPSSPRPGGSQDVADEFVMVDDLSDDAFDEIVSRTGNSL